MTHVPAPRNNPVPRAAGLSITFPAHSVLHTMRNRSATKAIVCKLFWLVYRRANRFGQLHCFP